ncbi:MAG: isochorismatase family protein [Candidatus Paceibacterota bacterium]
MTNYSFISIDLQNDFTTEKGECYRLRSSVNFLKNTLFPYFQDNNIRINEIISDYRNPRLGMNSDCCIPGTWGYKSIVPDELVDSEWIKCMNSPIWVRDNIGESGKEPGLPKQDPESFTKWLINNIGTPDEETLVLFGLTIDCCVLSTAQELKWRGYNVLILKEGVDHFSGNEEDKDLVFNIVIKNWAKSITWNDLISKIN